MSPFSTSRREPLRVAAGATRQNMRSRGRAMRLSPRLRRATGRRAYYSSEIGTGVTSGLSCIMYVMTHLREGRETRAGGAEGGKQ
jgi:hypothetical protein